MTSPSTYFFISFAFLSSMCDFFRRALHQNSLHGSILAEIKNCELRTFLPS
ncbi:dihydrolipoyllysine-residue succinyltransferase component of 2-oxoglutarate dehydrogenase complex 1, mitochondrial-like [Iris pallida]|uniref:Dihydrolipoyllysine-residue succinyltransferase component of 2-oxoglutarate dehydrogenase complex 1, mitochondrial-like n=1 Tax=Iris pallida TaxID=29817 RepID=A0AAX6FG58_IRIPA|nr:dihydrolipoyllysine-residue succinyltransferase component of 2-oxoglutarate dehydrogenase complex 1, mitochondrial-like [Iris pallida]